MRFVLIGIEPEIVFFVNGLIPGRRKVGVNS